MIYVFKISLNWKRNQILIAFLLQNALPLQRPFSKQSTVYLGYNGLAYNENGYNGPYFLVALRFRYNWARL